MWTGEHIDQPKAVLDTRFHYSNEAAVQGNENAADETQHESLTSC